MRSLCVLLQLPAARFLDIVGSFARVWSVRCMGDDEFRQPALLAPVWRAGSTPPAWQPSSLAAALAASAARPAVEPAAHAFLFSAAGMPASLSAKPEPLHCHQNQLQATASLTASSDSDAADTIGRPPRPDPAAAHDPVLHFLLQAGGPAWTDESDIGTPLHADPSPGSDLQTPFRFAGAGEGVAGCRRALDRDAGQGERAERHGAAWAGGCLDACGGVGLADWDVDVDAGGDVDSELLGLWGPEMQSAADACAPWPL